MFIKLVGYTTITIAIKLHAEPISILMMQVHMSISGYEDDEVEDLYDITEEIL